MLFSKTSHIPRGLKPTIILVPIGTAEAVPFQNIDG
jgi:hypothetical protein